MVASLAMPQYDTWSPAMATYWRKRATVWTCWVLRCPAAAAGGPAPRPNQLRIKTLSGSVGSALTFATKAGKVPPRNRYDSTFER